MLEISTHGNFDHLSVEAQLYLCRLNWLRYQNSDSMDSPSDTHLFSPSKITEEKPEFLHLKRMYEDHEICNAVFKYFCAFKYILGSEKS